MDIPVDITFIDYVVNFLRPYKDEPFFTTCIMKALKELGHGVTRESFYEESGPTKSCHITKSECDE